MHNNQHHEKKSFIGFGYSSILLSFVMISVMVFASLSFMTINADYTLTKKVAQKNQDYYAADAQAKQTLARISDMIEPICVANASRSEQLFMDLTLALNRESGTLTKDENGIFYEFETPYNGTSKIITQIRIFDDAVQSEPCYALVRWQAITNTPEEEENYLNLMDAQ